TNDNQPKIEVALRGPFSSPKLEEELALALQRNTGMQVVNSGGRFQVEIDVDSFRRENIGYLYDREPLSSSLINRLFPNEGRVTLGAKITIVDKHHLNRMIEHMQLLASSDYDFTNPNTLRDTQYGNQPLVEYSLGQFDSEDGAFDVASDLVQKKLARQLALYIGGICRTN
ncbi:MAG: hypothetical protein KGQ54_05335, partial [Verrucomicrobia bacterium]|nr:hypothetical protein [Verrucomicrobiota bacterium]